MQKESCFFSYSLWVLALADLMAVLCALLLAFIVRFILPGSLSVETLFSVLPLIILFPLLISFLRLYPGAFLHPAEEMKRLFLASTAGFLFIGASFFLTKSAADFSRLFFLLAWAATCVLLPLFRALVRRTFGTRPWWSVKAIIIGNAAAIEAIHCRLSHTPSLGLSPVAVLCTESPAFSVDSAPASADTASSGAPFSDTPSSDAAHPLDWRHFPVEGYPGEQEDIVEEVARQFPRATVLLHTDSFPLAVQERLFDVLGHHFRQVIAMPTLHWNFCIPSQILNMRGSFALVVRCNLADARRLRTKRILDLAGAIALVALLAPLFAFLVLWIKKDGKRPDLFRQARIGRDGKPFHIYKFRSMVPDADAVLDEYLNANPEADAEWMATQKLKNDPRITRAGAFLRSTSLDELPQLFNVLKGEMSLVGPRPIVEDEIDKYGEIFRQYSLVQPGITGLWQISGRNDVSYNERVSLDRYYVANWSVWLDLYILVQTIPAVFARRGAY